MRRVLVTGARGFLGRKVTARLAAAGFEVHAVTSSHGEENDGYIWHRADILNAADRERVIEAAGADALMHLAWCAKPPGYWTDPDNLRWLAATLELVRTFGSRGGIRIVGAGTCAEYDWRAGHCVEGSTPLSPPSLYGAAKAACGSVLESYGRQMELSVAWGRIFFLFGPNDDRSRLIPTIVRALDAGEPARCTAGNHVRDFIHVEDAADALVALLASNVTGPVNVASGQPMRVADLARAVAARTSHPHLLVVDDGPAENAVVTADIGRLRHEVGWSPQTETMIRIEETVRWWRDRREPRQGERDCA